MKSNKAQTKSITKDTKRQGRPGRLPLSDSAKITRKITAITLCVGLILATGKWYIYSESNSVGILSSLVHSTLDLLGSASSFLAVRYAAKPPNDKFKFGYGKAESFSAVFQVCLIILGAFHLFEAIIDRVSNPRTLIQGDLAIILMITLTLITFCLLILQTRAVKSTGSIAVRGDRAHYLADLFANIFVIVGIALSSFTILIWADAAVGGLMAIWLLWTAFKIAKLAWAQLMDKELTRSEKDLIRQLALEDNQVIAVHDLRTRASGPHIHIQMRLDLDDKISLAGTHDIVLAAENRMMKAFQAADILIYPHPVSCEHKHGNRHFNNTLPKN